MVHEVCVSYSTCSFVFVFFCVVPNCMYFPCCLSVFRFIHLRPSICLLSYLKLESASLPHQRHAHWALTLTISRQRKTTDPSLTVSMHAHKHSPHTYHIFTWKSIYSSTNRHQEYYNWFNNCIRSHSHKHRCVCHYIPLPAYILYLGMKNTSYKCTGIVHVPGLFHCLLQHLWHGC